MSILDLTSNAARPAAAAVAVAFFVIAAFDVYWALGGSWGLRAHWGGGYDELPVGLRVADAVNAVVFVVGMLVVLGRVQYWTLPVPFAVFRWGSWVFVALLAISTLVNFASSSNWERFLIAPVVLVLVILCVIIARSTPTVP